MSDSIEIDIVDDLLKEAERVRIAIGHVLPPDIVLREANARHRKSNDCVTLFVKRNEKFNSTQCVY